ncbi:MAG: hypothetical protein ACI8RZ_001779 [Myxococcota bacterium]|jgi:hypothetical protein
MSELTPCPHCAELLFTGASTCPHCGQHLTVGSFASPLPLLMLGIALVGCGDKDDTGDTGEDTIQPEPEYGVAATADEPEDAEREDDREVARGEDAPRSDGVVSSTPRSLSEDD